MAIAPLKVKHYPLSGLARIALLIALILNISVWLAFAYYYQMLVTGGTTALLVIPSIFTLVLIVLLLVLRFRYTLLEKYPYLINMPSFVYRLGMAKNPDTEGKVIGKVFTIHALSALYISALEAVIAYSGLMKSSRILFPSIVAVIAVFVITIFALYRSIYISFAKKR